MDHPDRKPRRRLIRGALGALGIAGGVAWLERDRVVRSLCEFLGTGHGTDADARARIGAAYLRDFGHEADVGHLETVLRSALTAGDEDPHAAPAADVVARASARIRRDFAEQATVSLDGWLLSRTEVRLCALEYLYSRRG